jgi:peroxiredoxin
MDQDEAGRTVGAGGRAPDFDLPRVEPEGRVALADFRGRAPLLLALFRSFECPFCRRLMSALKDSAGDLGDFGIETLGVTTTPVRAARLYARYRPPGLALASDPTLGVHRAYGLPIYRFTTEGPTRWPEQISVNDLRTIRLNPTGELPEALPVPEAAAALDRIDGFEIIRTDEQGPPDDVSPLVGYFLIDRTGTVRWRFVDALNDPAQYGRHPSRAELLAAARSLPS